MDNYKVLSKIGEGTYGLVYKAIHKELAQIVAIKQFKESDEDEHVRKTAMREIRILKQLKHENIVNLIEVFRWKGKIFLVFEYVPHTLLEELENFPTGLAPLEVKKYTWQLLCGVEFIHRHNVLHRDIKPENLLISKHGALKICDFGFARFMGGPDSLYTDYVSTRWYRAPELLVGDANYGKGIDVWAIGCLLAELTNGQPLFPGESDLRTLQYILSIIGGKLTEKQRSVLEKNPIFAGMEAVKICYSNSSANGSLEYKLPQLDEVALEFVKQSLAIDPEGRPPCASLLRHEYFKGLQERFAQEVQEMIQKDTEEFQMRTKAMLLSASASSSAPFAAPACLKSIGEDKLEDPSEEAAAIEPAVDEAGISKNPGLSYNEFTKGLSQGKAVSKVTITFNKPKHHLEHTGGSSELNSSFTMKTSTKVPPGGGAGPSTLILSNPLKQVHSKRTFKDADFQNPPSFLKGESTSSKYGDVENRLGLPQLKGKNIQSILGSNAPKVNRLVALPQITESKGGNEKLYLKDGSMLKQDLDSSFDGGRNANESVEGEDPRESSKAGAKGLKKGENRASMFPNIGPAGPSKPLNANPQPNVKIVDLQHNLMPFEKSAIIISENGTRIDTQSLKKQLISKKIKSNQFGNKPITPVPSEMSKIQYPYMILDSAQRLSRSNMTPVIHYGH